jgi:hypothetical protein
MDILDFLPKYPYEDEKNFYYDIYRKKEFYDNVLQRVEPFPKEAGQQTKYQRTIARYLSSYTPYNKLLLVHSPGLGKTCSAIGAVEQILKEEGKKYTGVIVLAKGRGLLENFKNELVNKCTDGKYIPDNFHLLTALQKKIRIKQKINFYSFKTYVTFARSIAKLSGADIKSIYSNKIIIVDEIHNIKPQDDEEKETYSEFFRFFHNIENNKILFLSGTPMKDSPDEISTLMNLLLPLDKQLPTGQNFISEFMKEGKDGINRIKKDSVKYLKSLFKGKVSFLKEPESSVQRKFIGKEKYRGLNHFIVDPLKMSEFQSKYYNEAYQSDISSQQGVFTNSRESSLFVYPDGSYGKIGFEKYIMSKEKESKKVKDYYMSNELETILRGENDEVTLKNIRKHSAIYAAVIKRILDTKGNCFIYSSIAKGSGAILFSLLLRLFNFSKAFGNEKTKALRYALLTKISATDTMIKNIARTFNKSENKKGEYIKVIIGTKAISEGYSFNNVVFESINTPHWNYSETAQAIARGIRLGSHNDLINDGENPVVEILQPVAIPKNGESIDLKLYLTSEDKDISISSVIRLLIESAIDCGLNYRQNVVIDRDYTRECNYMKCDYTCDGIDMKIVENGLDKKDIDYLTYNLYYANEPISNIKNTITDKLQREKNIGLDNVKEYLQNIDYTRERIDNVLSQVSKYKSLDLKTFRKLYNLSPVKNIILDLEKLFRSNNSISFQYLKNHFKEFTEFELLLSLQIIINDNIIIKDKYNFSCYLREDKNIYYLTGLLTNHNDYFLSYYTQNPFTQKEIDFNIVLDNLIKSGISNKLDLLTELAEDEKNFAEQIKLLNIDIQEYLLKASIIAKINKIETNIKLRDAVLKFYKNLVKKEGETIIINLSKPLCLIGKSFSDWTECEEKVIEQLGKEKEEKLFMLKENNPYGLYGTYNPQKDIFYIVDIEKEKKSKETKAATREKAKQDKRIKFGKNCLAGWSIPELITIMAERLKINVPEDFMEDAKKPDLLEIIRKDKRQFLQDLAQKYRNNLEGLKRVAYWGLKKYKGNAKVICENMFKWFKENNLLITV